jgi:hypothetical protein
MRCASGDALLTRRAAHARRFFAKGSNCCAALRAEVAAACAAAAAPCPANAPTMRCADLLAAAAAPASPYPPELRDWTCTAFPDDDLPVDSLLVALIALAVALPVTIFLSGVFELANDSEAPESWLRYAGLGRMLCGRLAHRKWHYTGPLEQPPRFARWYIRSADAPAAESLARGVLALGRALAGALRALCARKQAAAPAGSHAHPRALTPLDDGVKPVADAGDEVARLRRNNLQASILSLLMDGAPPVEGYAAHEEHPLGRGSVLVAVNDEATRARRDSVAMAISLLLTGDEPHANAGAFAEAKFEEPNDSRSSLYAADGRRSSARDSLHSITWRMRSHPLADDDTDVSSADGADWRRQEALQLWRRKRALTRLGLVGVAGLWACFAWFILTYGLLIYEMLGLDAERAFTRSWAVSYGVGAATEWREVARQALTAIAVLAVAERLHLTRPVSWLEDHVDYVSTSALLLEHGGLSFFQEVRLLFTFRRRLSD